MNIEKVKEIKKVLEFQRDSLVYLKDNVVEYVSCKDILTLINELESENEKLKQHKRELEGGQRDLLKVIKEFDKETQQLKDRIAELETLCNKTYEDLAKEIDRLESENAYQKEHIELWFRKNEEKKNQIDELEKENARLEKVVKHNQELIEDGKLISSEQLKQFAERLKERMNEGEYMGEKYKLSVFRDIDIDETLKEFIKDRVEVEE